MPVPEVVGVAQRVLLRDEVFQRLREAIVDGSLQPGERLHDAALEQWLGVSRTPIREALARLEQVGLVQTQPGRMTRVSPLDLRAAQDAQAVTAAMHVLAVREALLRLSVAEWDLMRSANRRFAEALRNGDADGALQADDAFHDVMVRAAGNVAVQSVLAQYTPVLRRVERLRFSSLSARASVAQHDRILAACQAGDVEAAATSTQENWQTLQPLLAQVTDQPDDNADGVWPGRQHGPARADRRV